MNDDLFASEWAVGNLESISVIKSVLSLVSVVVISTIGFGIIIMTIVRNAIDGLYAVSPKFWDKVDEAKRSQFNATNDGGNQISKLLGSGLSFLLVICPNIKAMSNFEDGVKDPKTYFTVSLIKAVVQIFIGVFIFWGYPAQIADKMSTFGTGVIDMVLLNVDPLAWVEKLPTEFAVVDLTTDGAPDDESKAVNKIAKTVWNTYAGSLDDMTSEKRLTTALEIEQWVISNTAAISEYTNTDKYGMSVSSRIALTEPDISRVHEQVSNGIRTFAFYAPVDQFEHGSAKETANMYIRYDLVFTPVASKGDTRSVSNTMTIPKNGTNAKVVADSSANSITITISDEVSSSYGFVSLNRVSGYVVAPDGSNVKVRLTVNGNVVSVVADGSSKNISQATSITSIGGLYYKYGNNKHKIEGIMFGSGSSVAFMPANDSEGIASWGWGDSPTAMGSEEETTSLPSISNGTGGWGNSE